MTIQKLIPSFRTFSEPVVSCLECQSCLEGDRALCERQIGFVGYNRPGGLQSVVNVPERHLHIVPDSVPLDIAAVAEPLSVSWHAVSKSGFKKGESVLVIGAGPIGILAVKYAASVPCPRRLSLTFDFRSILKARGASFVAVSEPSSVRREIAKASGADLVFNPLEEDAVAAVRKATNGGVNVAIDCAGEPTAASSHIVLSANQPYSTFFFLSLQERNAPLTPLARRLAPRVALSW